MKSQFHNPPLADIRTEAERILEMCGGNLKDAMAVVERQFSTLHNRAQVLFSLCGIVVTVTGFSGRLIAGTNAFAQAFLVSGLAVVVACALYVWHGVMTLRWATQRLAASPQATMVSVLQRRDVKTAAYRRGGYILFAGFILYSVAIAIMLLNPAPLLVPVR